MSRKKALFASSLTVCSASTSFAVGSNDGSVAYAEDQLQYTQPRHIFKTDLTKSVHAYLKSVSVNAVSNKTKKPSEPLTYKVKKDDNLYRIGLYFGIHYQDLAAYNHIAEPHKLQIGQEIKIPIQTHWITLRERVTAQSLAKEYQTSTALIVDLNPMFKKQMLAEKGQSVLVPKQLNFTRQHSLHQPLKQTVKKRKKIVKFAESKPKQTSHYFQWPVKGQITSKFGWRRGRQHKGIDIWNAAKSRALIYASRGGVVTRAGFTNGYGNLVVIDHGSGWVTYYAHLSKISVGRGQRLQTGDVVGNMGKTGRATGYHLHFEIRKNGEAMNPLSMLR